MARASRRRFHYIYRTTCTITGRYYIGMHSTDNLDDGYIGSGKQLRRSINKHGIENHQREILEYHSDRDALKVRERELVNEDSLSDPLCMNLKLGGEGGWESLNKNSELQRQKNLKGQAVLRRLAETDPEWVARRRQNLTAGLKRSHAEGRRRHTLPDKPAGWKHTPEALQKMRGRRLTGAANGSFGSRWMHDPAVGLDTKVRASEVDSHLSKGWMFGRYKGSSYGKTSS